MKPTLAASLIALAVAAPAAAQSGAPGGFRLPPNPTPTPTANPDIQGPIDPDAPFRTRPRAPTPTPTPRAGPIATPTPIPSPTAAPPRRVSTPTPQPRPSAVPSARPPTPAPTQPATVVDQSALPTSLPSAPAQTAPFQASPSAPIAPAASESDGWPWGWIALGVLAALGAAAAAFMFLRRREESYDEAPVIEPPLARAAPPAGEPGESAPGSAAGNPLAIEAQALQLSRSVMYATLSYELRLANRGKAPLADIRLGGDLVTAHGRIPVEQQLADAAHPLAIVQQVPSLAPGESATVTGELRIPVQEIRPIPQGGAVLYVPLLRVRAEAEGMAPFARTFVVGKRPSAPGGRLQPFRLDETPQTYRSIAQRALD